MECEDQETFKDSSFFSLPYKSKYFSKVFFLFSQDDTGWHFFFLQVLCIFQIFYTKNYILLLHSEKKKHKWEKKVQVEKIAER